MKKPQKLWSKTEKENFIIDWKTLKKAEILQKYNRKYTCLKAMAYTLKIKKDFPQNHYKLNKLLEETNLAYYWLGFLVADGHFTKNNFVVGLSNLDYNHLAKLAIWLNVNIHKKEKHCVITCGDSYNIPIIRSKFKLLNDKTYHGADFDINNKQLFFSFLTGLIDGDGCFCLSTTNKVNMIRIHCHISYENFYKKISQKLETYGISSRIYTCSRGYCKFVISKQKFFIQLYNEMLACNIPYLERKWNRLYNLKNINSI